MDSAELENRYALCDVKAEVVAADLVEMGVKIDNVVIRPLGSFARKYRKDILQYSNSDEYNHSESDNLLFIDVSREGIFDSLPQRLFYQPDPKKLNEGVQSRLDEFRKQREEESESRKFFLVFEKEFYQCKTLIELEERKSIFGMSEQFNTDLFTDIWVELRNVPSRFHKYLFQILPLAYKCRGDVNLTEALLGFVLNEHVSIHVFAEPVMRTNTFSANQLGKRFIGADFVLGNETPSYDALYKIKVGPLKKKNLHHYMYAGEHKKVIDFLMDYFIPFDADFEVELVLEKDSEKLLLLDSETFCYLGFDSKI